MTHKPKLVAVTNCSPGAGTTTIATGLAAALSETGDGNVLLVDMHQQNGMAHPFYRGKPKCGLSDILEGEHKENAQVQDNLYMVSASEANGLVPRILPTQFTHLVPKLKASDYDYIIFDMPQVSQTSVTPRLAGFMDMVLLVVESEKTNRDVAKRAWSMLSESGANVRAILNRYRTYVPKSLDPEL
jgi:Mrp family chromosome partitioning ATPase